MSETTRPFVEWLPDEMGVILDLFKKKNKSYKDSWRSFGLRGIVSQLDRKHASFITHLWDASSAPEGETLELLREHSRDLIVYGFFLLYLTKYHPTDLTGSEFRNGRT